jgi:hypothetical protein
MDQNRGLDWQERESILAAVKVALRRVLIRFGVERGHANHVVGQIISCLHMFKAELDKAAEKLEAS